MKSTAKKSSFTLPASEVSLVKRLKQRLQIRSNTGVIRMALRQLERTVDRKLLRQQFQEASKIVSQGNREDMAELDRLSDEGLCQVAVPHGAKQARNLSE